MKKFLTRNEIKEYLKLNYMNKPEYKSEDYQIRICGNHLLSKSCLVLICSEKEDQKVFEISDEMFFELFKMFPRVECINSVAMLSFEEFDKYTTTRTEKIIKIIDEN